MRIIMRMRYGIIIHVDANDRGQSSRRLLGRNGTVMSRIIVKNVPPKATEKTLSELFSQCGEVTDAKLIRTQSGLSRKFGFVGFVSDSQARTAVEKFDRTFIDASRISVQVAKPYGDESLERPWSKYSHGSSAYLQRERVKREREWKRLEEEGGRGEKWRTEKERELEKTRQQRVKQDLNKSKLSSMLSEYYEVEQDADFQEFLSMHTHKSKVQTWADGLEKAERRKEKQSKRSEGVEHKRKKNVKPTEKDGLKEEEGKKLQKVKSKLVSVESKRHGGKGMLLTHTPLAFDGVSESEEMEGTEVEGENREDGMKVESAVSGVSSGRKESGVAMAESGVSDMDYLQSKVVAKLSTEEATTNDGELESAGEAEAGAGGNGGEKDSESSSDESSNSKDEEEETPANQNTNEFSSTMFTLRMRGLPFRATREDVETFFYPTEVVAVRFTVDKDGRPSGRAYVDFNSEGDMALALKRNGDCIGKRYIELFRDEGPQSMKDGKQEAEEKSGSASHQLWGAKSALQLSKGEEDETIADSGRLFLRNLSYTVSEGDLTEAFEKFGPLTEVTIPLDKSTNRPTGLGFVTFMLPEHAVKAYESLDGQVFQGRLLHVLPARPRQSRAAAPAEDDESPGGSGSSFKKKKESLQKSQAGSSHNWNTLFLGANAVVDAMAQRYSTRKSSILDAESGHSVAVRMALGETQLVTETREFLQAHGVKLNVFEQKRPKRSSTVVLAKNLPHGTKQSELQDLFSAFGSLHRVILPPSGISALVEFLEPSHAKSAFKRLAYSKFKHLPLYLEWAPLGVTGDKEKEIDKTPTASTTEESGEDKVEKDDNDGEVGGEEMQVEKEPGEQCTVFVKNVNFSTNQDQLIAVFSKVGSVKKAEIARKRNMKDPAHPLSMGFGFVEFSTPQLAQQALKDLQHCEVEGHKLELKLSHRGVQGGTRTAVQHQGRKATKETKQRSSKIMVRNIPFEASQKEVRELFQTFGQLKTVRLPKKLATVGEHRGFGFVEFVTKEDAKRAFESLCQSTHLYGRRLVLEWAEGDESVEQIRKRTAEHFHGLRGGPSSMPSKRRKAELLLYGKTGGHED